MKRVSTVALALPLLLLVLAGCGSSSSSSTTSATGTSSSTPAPATGAATTVAVSMQNIAFNPTSVNAKVGDTVKWTNNDSVAHNVTYVSGPKFTSSSTFSGGGTFSLKLTKAGTIQYRCTIHPGMNGTIVVG
jgi:plastocyanin